MGIDRGGIAMQERLTRPITKSEIKLFNSTRPSGSKYSKEDYVEKRGVTDLECYKKLGQLEDKEEKLGIDLQIGCNALLYGIYTTDYGYIDGYSLCLEKYRIGIPRHSVSLPFVGPVGYGKTWALTKEELE